MLNLSHHLSDHATFTEQVQYIWSKPRGLGEYMLFVGRMMH